MKQQLLTDSVLCGSCSGRPASSGSLQGGSKPSLFRVSPGALHTPGSNRADSDRLLFWNPGTVSLAFSPPEEGRGKNPPLPPSPTSRANFHFSNSWSDFRFTSPCFLPTANYAPGDSGRGQAQGVSVTARCRQGRENCAGHTLRRGNDTRTTFVKYLPCKISTKF